MDKKELLIRTASDLITEEEVANQMIKILPFGILKPTP